MNYQNENNSLIIIDSNQIYSKNYFFNLVSDIEVNSGDYNIIVREIQTLFLQKYSSFVSQNVITTIIWQEEYLNANRDIVRGLSVLISIDNKPIDQLIELDRSIFKHLRSLPIDEDTVYKFYLPEDDKVYLQPLSKALTFYSNILICRRDFYKFEKLIRQIIIRNKHDLKEDIKVIVTAQKKFINQNGKLYWKVHVLTTFLSDNKIIDLRMDSSLIVNEIKSRIDFISSNDETYEISSNVHGLMDMKNHFSLFIDGRINQKVNLDINRAIEYTWNLTAYQTRNFESYFIKNYKFIFMPLNEIEVASDGRIQTKITYFISSNGQLASVNDFSLVPKLNWIQDTFTKYALPYILLS